MNKKSYCMNCKKEVGEEVEKCKCGGTNFVFGDKFHFEGKQVVCDCGNKEFETTFHMDYVNKGTTSYKCPKCGNLIGVESYRTDEYAGIFDDVED